MSYISVWWKRQCVCVCVFALSLFMTHRKSSEFTVPCELRNSYKTLSEYLCLSANSNVCRFYCLSQSASFIALEMSETINPGLLFKYEKKLNVLWVILWDDVYMMYREKERECMQMRTVYIVCIIILTAGRHIVKYHRRQLIFHFRRKTIVVNGFDVNHEIQWRSITQSIYASVL